MSKNFHYFTIALVSLFILYIFIKGGNDLQNLEKNKKFTVAIIVTDWHRKNMNGIGYDYEYFVNNTKYEGTLNREFEKGKKYLLMYDSTKISNHLILQIYQLPENFRIPENGWNYEEIPIKKDSNEIRNYIESF